MRDIRNDEARFRPLEKSHQRLGGTPELTADGAFLTFVPFSGYFLGWMPDLILWMCTSAASSWLLRVLTGM
jgi:hypothetical protein